jgi:DNA-binding NarL/FixJ family response regulator
MYLENGNTFRQLARLAGVSEANIARRIRKLTSRLTDGNYVLCLRNRDKLTKAEMTIAKEYFLLGLSQKKIASKRKRTFYQVRNTIEKIQRLIKAPNGT